MSQHLARWLLCCCLVPLGCPALAGAQEGQRGEAQPRIWGALVKASESGLGGKSGLDRKMAERLERSLSSKYKHFQLLGEHTQALVAEYESWLVPSEELFMRVDSKGPVTGGMSLHLQLWRRENVLVKTDAVLAKDSPLFITGPMWGDDQLIFILELLD